MKVNRFIQSSDYATLKNDGVTTTAEIEISVGHTFDPTTGILGFADVVKGGKNAGIRASWLDDDYPSLRTIGTTFLTDIDLSIPALGAFFTQALYCEISRINSTTVRMTVAIEKNPGAPTHRVESLKSIHVSFSTFLNPFD